MRVLLFFFISALLIAAPAEARIELQAPLTLYLAPAGDDARDCTDQALPCRTRARAYDRLRRDYDLRCYGVVVQHAHGTYTDGFIANGMPVGQCGFGQIVFRGDVSNPGAVLIKPSSGPAFQASNHAALFVEGMTLDARDAGADSVVTTTFSEIGLGRNVFGRVRYPHQAIQIGALSRGFVYDGYAINAGSVSTVASITAGSNVIGVGNPGGVEPFMGASSACLPDGAWVQSVAGAWVTIGGGKAHCSAGADPITFSYGGQAHAQLDSYSQLGYASSPVAPLDITVHGKPHYASGFIVVDAATALVQAARFRSPTGAAAEASGAPFAVYHGGVLFSGVALPNGDQDLGYLPGLKLTVQASFAFGTQTVAISAADAERIRQYFAANGYAGLGVSGPGIANGTVIPSIDAVGASSISINMPTEGASAGAPLTIAGFAWSGGEYSATTPVVSPPR